MLLTLRHILVTSLLLPALLICANTSAAMNKSYTVKDGLSSSYIHQIYQDSEGYIWICTDRGLNRFDGEHFLTFRHDPSDNGSLPDDVVMAVLEDSRRRLWVGTNGGLALYNREMSVFAKIADNSSGESTDNPEDRKISCIAEDRNGILWVGTHTGGILWVDPEGTVIRRFDASEQGVDLLNISAFMEDSAGRMWIGTFHNGVSCYNPHTGRIRTYAEQQGFRGRQVSSFAEDNDGRVIVATLDAGMSVFDETINSFFPLDVCMDQIVFDIICSDGGELWIATDGNGIKRTDTAKGSVSNYLSRSDNFITSGSKIHNLMKDRQGNIWASVHQKGIYSISSSTDIFNYYSINPFFFGRGENQYAVLSVLEDSNGTVWTGTDGGGLLRTPKGGDKPVRLETPRLNSLKSNVITALYEAHDGNIWIGTYMDGALMYSPASGRIEKHILHPDHRNHIVCITEEGGDILLGTNRGGVLRLPGGSGTAQVIDDGILSRYDYINCFHRQGDTFWIGTNRGLVGYNSQWKMPFPYSTSNSDLDNNTVLSLTHTEQTLWIGTAQGLFSRDAGTGVISRAASVNLPADNIAALEHDDLGNIWIATPEGIAMFTPLKGDISHYEDYPEIFVGELSGGCSFKGSGGELYFGGTAGAFSFIPPLDKEQVSPINLVFTHLSYFDRTREADEGLVRTDIGATDNIVIEPHVKSFTVGFQALTFNSPSPINYLIRLSGDEWEEIAEGVRSVTYANLKPGRYTLEVMARVSDTEPLTSSIGIIVKPPFWVTPAANVIYAIAAVLLLYVAYRLYRRKTRIAGEKARQKQAEEMMRFKLDFFTDISHEIRTPLTLVSSPLSKLMSATHDPVLLKKYTMMKRNADRILSLINETIDIRKLDNDQYRLKVSRCDVVSMMSDIISFFEDEAGYNAISIIFHPGGIDQEVWLDKGCFEKVMFNLISNAIKHSPGNTDIDISVTGSEGILRVVVRDAGEGIPEHLTEKIFDNFFQVGSDYILSSGLGLYLSRKFISMHRGRIYACNNPDGPGSSFTVELPLGRGHFTADQFAPEGEKPSLMSSGTIATPNADIGNRRDRMRSQRKVLIVEDDTQVRKYLRDEISPYYRVLEASNGKIGLQKTREQAPDIIISDIVMPRMDGVAMSAAIKSSPSLSHIPVILLTARSSAEEHIEGMSASKADMYVTKPFSMEYLLVCINNLLRRPSAAGTRAGEESAKAAAAEVRSADEKFAERFARIVDSNIANENLTVEMIGRELGISRVHLHRRIKTLYGVSPSDHIRDLRLKRAEAILVSKNVSVSEAAYMVGFSSGAYFAAAFKKMYGVSPTEYVGLNCRKNKRT